MLHEHGAVGDMDGTADNNWQSGSAAPTSKKPLTPEPLAYEQQRANGSLLGARHMACSSIFSNAIEQQRQ
jgi:hypothetical protein